MLVTCHIEWMCTINTPDLSWLLMLFKANIYLRVFSSTSVKWEWEDAWWRLEGECDSWNPATINCVIYDWIVMWSNFKCWLLSPEFQIDVQVSHFGNENMYISRLSQCPTSKNIILSHEWWSLRASSYKQAQIKRTTVQMLFPLLSIQHLMLLPWRPFTINWKISISINATDEERLILSFHVWTDMNRIKCHFNSQVKLWIYYYCFQFKT